ncbi:hypothetical protein ASPZODRAFT_63629 [Penicilliopsis zonata CBS 506.65]|uniref:Folliculin-interacting protein N-terminal domain-containing protein n=1 Tax=Penicilliopsis zonata CBS 506.65 TaxID=1073090 RepID=A0A1L9SLH3_9EURO|nr:hypothetical protein ASPZODRAFT_63629 [Penicilliopsis zonata CBS 506.65]OJJ47973.1 hypothetical protein ASPZODRAFT_63629 [Penicilliopsis zonata CBS 506.65]
MLGRLLNTAASTLNPGGYPTRNNNPTHLESVTEEEHTSGLLFPDASLLRRSTAHAYPLQSGFNSSNASVVGAYDDRGGLELDPVKDFRVIIAQNALGDRDPCVLLDTRVATDHPSSSSSSSSSSVSPRGLGIEPPGINSAAPAATGGHARTFSNASRTSRRSQLLGSQASSIIADSSDARKSLPMSPATGGAFSRARGRSSTLSPGAAHHEPYHSRGDTSDTGLLNCIFGSSVFSYRGSSTKMHIISADEEAGLNNTPSSSSASHHLTSPPNGTDGPVRSPLSRAYTTGSQSGFVTPLPKGVPTESKQPSKVTFLVTRMFSVNLPETGDASVVAAAGDRADYATSIYQESLPDSGFPFPDVSKRKKVKEKKTPMYAVAITIQIPLLARSAAARPASRFSTQGPDSPRFAMACSLDSDYRWRGGLLEDSLSSASTPASLDERIDLLVDHWDVITRTLSHLERLARKEILFLLKKVDSLSGGAHPKPAKPPNMQRTNQTIVHLPANILAVNSRLREEALRSTRRISLALQMPYVVTGQSRWGVWREEGRSIVRSLGDKEHGFFFLVLITAFLGNHTEWLSVLGPDWYRRRHHLQQKAQTADADPGITSRTVIVSPDKMTARRLIFLLAAFLPAKQRFEPLLPSPLRPGTSTSIRAVSQSPPNNIPVLRQESLRRAIERRARAQRLNLGDRDPPTPHQRSVSASSNETTHRSSEDVERAFAATTDTLTHRRGSDARSIKTLGIGMGGGAKDLRAKKAATATTSTTTPSSTVPVPHFASHQARPVDVAAEGLDSLASETLLRNLKRSESSAVSTTTSSSIPSAGGRWGSLFFSGLFSSSRQESGTEDTEVSPSLPPHSDSRRRSISTFPSSAKQRAPTLSQMVKEATGTTIPEHPTAEAPTTTLTTTTTTTATTTTTTTTTSNHISIPKPPYAKRASQADEEEDNEDVPGSMSLPDHSKDFPLKLSVRAEDGVVDVDLPLPGFVSLSSSGDSTVASPKKTRTSITSMDVLGSTHSSSSGFHCAPKEHEGPNINVGGWLKGFHEDLLLQAVRPYNNLEADIKRAMQAEPTPYAAFSVDADGSDRWVDVASTLIADTRTFTVKRLRLRRKVPLHSRPLRSPISPPSGFSQPGTPRHVSSGGLSSASQFSNFFFSTSSSSHMGGGGGGGGGGIGSRPSNVEEKFVEETVMDLDGILVDAVERVLAQSGQSSLAHSRAPSPSRHRTAKADEIRGGGDETVPSLEVPRGECRKTVLGALEEVVRSVTAEHCREDVDGELGLADREQRRVQAGADNTLREGIRKWLLDIEEAW